jgi:hypothetical protein
MRLFRPLALFLTTLVSAPGIAQTPAKPAAPALKAAADILPFAATEKTLPNGL